MLVEVESLFGGCPHAELFHYTSNAAVLGIAQSRSLWATEIRYLNDSSELINAFRTIGRAALIRASSHCGDQAVMLSDFYRWCEKASTTDRTVFVVSLTENGNLLSQWRAYAGVDGQGAALAFDAQRLQVLAKGQGFRLGRCIYDPAEHVALAERVVDHLLEVFSEQGAKASEPNAQESLRFYGMFDGLYPEIISLAALMKDAAFHEEVEWRLVSPVAPSGQLQELEFRPGRTCLIPYLNFRLAEQDGSVHVLLGANIGPSQNPNLAIASLQMLLSRHLQGGYRVRNLLIPLRASV